MSRERCRNKEQHMVVYKKRQCWSNSVISARIDNILGRDPFPRNRPEGSVGLFPGIDPSFCAFCWAGSGRRRNDWEGDISLILLAAFQRQPEVSIESMLGGLLYIYYSLQFLEVLAELFSNQVVMQPSCYAFYGASAEVWKSHLRRATFFESPQEVEALCHLGCPINVACPLQTITKY